jgi:hypothetical protein
MDLQESQNELNLLSLAIDEVSEGPFLFDADNRLVFVNKARWYVTQGIAEVVEIGAMLEQSLWDCLNARLSRHAFENPKE